MHLIAKAIRISRAKFHCNRLTTVQDIQDYKSHFVGGGDIRHYIQLNFENSLKNTEQFNQKMLTGGQFYEYSVLTTTMITTSQLLHILSFKLKSNL